MITFIASRTFVPLRDSYANGEWLVLYMYGYAYLYVYVCVLVFSFPLLFFYFMSLNGVKLRVEIIASCLCFSTLILTISYHSIEDVFGKPIEVLLSIIVPLKMPRLMKLFNFTLKLVLFLKRMGRNKWPLIYIVL